MWQRQLLIVLHLHENGSGTGSRVDLYREPALAHSFQVFTAFRLPTISQQELGGSETLMGLSLTVTCMAEIPGRQAAGLLPRP